MMRVQIGDQLAHEIPQRLRREDRDARAPGHQVMGDLQKAADAEFYRQRAVALSARLWLGWNRKERASAAAGKLGLILTG